MNFTAIRLDAAWHRLNVSTSYIPMGACIAGVALMMLLTAVSSRAQGVTDPVSASAAAPATAASSNEPLVQFQPAVRELVLATPPKGFVWQRIEAIEVAVLTPEDWKMHHKREAYGKTYAFSGEPLNDKGQFETGFTVQLMWHPQLPSINAAKAADLALQAISKSILSKTDNQLLRGTLDNKAGKKVLIIRYRNAPQNLTPIIVHIMVIADPLTGLVYQFVFESPESRWAESWKIGEQILSRLWVSFKRG